MRGTVLGLIGILGAASLGSAPPVAADDAKPLPARLVGDLRTIFGNHHARAVHAKGLVFAGTFEPDPAAKTLSSAVLFDASVPVTVRLSDTTGIPTIPDNDPNADPRGMAVRFATSAGPVDIACHSYNGFPAKDAATFAVFLEAILASGPDAPKPTPLETFLSSHPAALRFATEQGPPPVSFATTTFYCVTAYALTGTDGTVHPVRYRLVPEAGDQRLTREEAAAKDPEYLMDDIEKRVASAPVRFRWMAQLAAEGDVIDDPSTPWPEERELVTLGTVSVEAAAADQAAANSALLFIPSNVVPGIAPADPMIAVRSSAYGVSYAGRR
jgi:catalase